MLMMGLIIGTEVLGFFDLRFWVVTLVLVMIKLGTLVFSEL